jgi:hypothetical protein
MKACLMKVNYDPKYTHPHTQATRPDKPSGLYESSGLHARLTLTKEIYGPALPERRHLRETLEDAARKKIHRNSAPDTKEIARIQADAEKAHIERYKKSVSEVFTCQYILLPGYIL